MIIWAKSLKGLRSVQGSKSVGHLQCSCRRDKTIDAFQVKAFQFKRSLSRAKFTSRIRPITATAISVQSFTPPIEGTLMRRISLYKAGIAAGMIGTSAVLAATPAVDMGALKSAGNQIISVTVALKMS